VPEPRGAWPPGHAPRTHQLARVTRASPPTRSVLMSLLAGRTTRTADEPGSLAAPCGAGLAAGVRPAADPAEVADHAGTDQMMTFKVLQTLMDRGLVIRQPDPADGRVKHLVLTPDGMNLPGAASASRSTSTRRCSARWRSAARDPPAHRGQGPDRFLTRTEPGPGTVLSARAPNGIRTRAAALKGRCPRPLDDGGRRRLWPP
jgi:hypothetical protein